jgi:hypothetical protein
MLQQVCRRARLVAQMETEIQAKGVNANPFSILISDESGMQDSLPAALKLLNIQDAIHTQILDRLQSQGSLHVDCRTFPLPENQQILTNYGVLLQRLPHNGRTFGISSLHQANAAVVYRDSHGTWQSADIHSMWIKEISNTTHTFIVIAPHLTLTEQDGMLDPWCAFPGFKNQLVYSETHKELTVIEPLELVSHAPYCLLPGGTYGINAGTKVVHMNLSLGRRW